MDDGMSSGEMICFHIDLEMIHVDSPSLMMHRWIGWLHILIRIWKATSDGKHGWLSSKSKMIRRVSNGSNNPKVERNIFLWDGKVWRTSKIDMTVGYSSKSSTSFYKCVSIAWGLFTFVCNGIWAIWVVVSVLGWRMINGFSVAIGGWIHID